MRYLSASWSFFDFHLWSFCNFAPSHLGLHHHICLVTFLALFTCQADKELQPWIAKDDDLGQKMWRINQRIVKLIAEVMRNHDTPESLVILASAPDLLLRATDGMLVDGEACTLPQLEVITTSVKPILIEVYLWFSKLGLSICSGVLSNMMCLNGNWLIILYFFFDFNKIVCL